MKKYFLLFAISLVLFSCSDKNITITKFKTALDTIPIKGKTYLEWEVANADSIVIKQKGFDEPIIENAALKSRMLISPSMEADYILNAYNNDNMAKANCQLFVLDTTKRDTVLIVKPHVTRDPNAKASKYLKGIENYENLTTNTKLKAEIFFIDKLNYPNEIKLFISVKDTNGNFIANLAPPFGSQKVANEFFNSLSVNVNDRNFRITDFDVEERHDTLAQKYNYSLVLDHSGSMYNMINELQNSVQNFLKKIPKEDNVSVIKFDHNIENTILLSSNKKELLNPNLYKGLYEFGGGTALIAAADQGIRNIARQKNSKIEVLFTDGLENSSFYSAIVNGAGLTYKPSQLIYNARDKNVKIFTIGYGYADTNLLEKISLLTDGKSYYANDGKEIEDIFNELPRIFSNYYMLTFKPIKEDGEHEIILVYQGPDEDISSTSRKTYIGKIDLSELDVNIRQCVAFFEFSKDNIADQDLSVIQLIGNYLSKDPNSILEIHGHTDLSGSKVANMELSRRRAEAVSKEFIRSGIDKRRIKIIPHGSDEPVFKPELSDYHKEQNRRVEFEIKGK